MAPHLCGLIARISTHLPAQESSLQVQLQRLRSALAARGDDWTEAECYVLEGVSGKDSVRSPEFARLFADLQAGRVNTVCCTALDRVSRSVKDFLHFFEVLQEHGSEFVSLRESYDTTTPQGRLIVLILMALAQFEREQTGQRIRDSAQARAAAGRWTGGRLLGYDGGPEGTLELNGDAETVRRIFEAYLEAGTYQAAADTLNRAGVRTAGYVSARGIEHPPGLWNLYTVRNILRNRAYLGERGGRPAQWPALVGRGLWERVQARMRTYRTRARTRQRWPYLLAGLIRCATCGRQMRGSTTVAHGRAYPYYRCDCARIPAEPIHRAVRERVAQLSGNPGLLAGILAEANRRAAAHLPAAEGRRAEIARQLAEADRRIGALVEGMAGFTLPDAIAAVEGKLADLAASRRAMAGELERVEGELEAARAQVVDPGRIRAAMRAVARWDAEDLRGPLAELIQSVVWRGDVLEIAYLAPGSNRAFGCNPGPTVRDVIQRERRSRRSR